MTQKKILLEDFEKAILQLESALKGAPDSDLEKAGCIQYFEFCFELAWKCIRTCSLEEGLADCLSPKSCLKQAFTQNWIDDEAVWLAMLDSRNLMSHTYNASRALVVYDSLASYLPVFKNLLVVLKKR